MASSPVRMTTDNPSGIIPSFRRVIVEVEMSETERRMKAANLAIPDEFRERDHHASMTGRILAVSRDVRFDLEPGLRVMWGRYAGTMVNGVDGNTYRIVDDEDVKGVIDGN